MNKTLRVCVLSALLVSCAPRQQTTSITWPPNYGCATPEDATILTPGLLIDRYHASPDNVFSLPGTPYGERSLPYAKPPGAYHIYQVMKPLPAQECKLAPAFGEPGGGQQFRSMLTVAMLKSKDIIQMVQ